MTKHQFSSPFVVSTTEKVFQTAERLHVLSGQNAVLIEQLRQLQFDTLTIAGNGVWQRLENEVLRLRAEFELLSAIPADSFPDIIFLTDHDNAVN